MHKITPVLSGSKALALKKKLFLAEAMGVASGREGGPHLPHSMWAWDEVWTGGSAAAPLS